MCAAVLHGAINIIGEAPVFASLSTQSLLLGPNSPGCTGMSVPFTGAILLIWKLPNKKSVSQADESKTDILSCQSK